MATLSLVADDQVGAAAHRVGELLIQMETLVHGRDPRDAEWRRLQRTLVDSQMALVNTAQQSLDASQPRSMRVSAAPCWWDQNPAATRQTHDLTHWQAATLAALTHPRQAGITLAAARPQLQPGRGAVPPAGQQRGAAREPGVRRKAASPASAATSCSFRAKGQGRPCVRRCW